MKKLMSLALVAMLAIAPLSATFAQDKPKDKQECCSKCPGTGNCKDQCKGGKCTKEECAKKCPDGKTCSKGCPKA